MQFGYFSSANQEVPEYDPGLNVNCPVCEKLLDAPMKTISVLLDGDSRSFFYRTHKDCYENLTEDERIKLDSLIVDVRYIQKALQSLGGLTKRAADASLGYDIPEGYDAICSFCHYPFTFQNSKSSGAKNWNQFCCQSCENGTTEHRSRR